MEEYGGEWLKLKDAIAYIKKTKETNPWWKIESKKNNHYINIGLTFFVDCQNLGLLFDLPIGIDAEDLNGEFEISGEINKIPLKIIVNKCTFDFSKKLILIKEWSCLYQQRREHFRVNILPFKKSYLQINIDKCSNETFAYSQKNQPNLRCDVLNISLGGIKAETSLSYFPNFSVGSLIKEAELVLPDTHEIKTDFFLRRLIKSENKGLLMGSLVNLNGKDAMALERFIIDAQRNRRT